MKTTLKRVYEEASPQDGLRILVDRLWPRGLSREKAHIDAWLKELAPSTALRQWYQHDAEKWTEFRQRYFAELDDNPEALEELRRLAGKKHVTLLFSSREEKLNNAAALKDYLEKHASR